MKKTLCSCGKLKTGKSSVCRQCMVANYAEHNDKFRHGHNGASGKSRTYTSWDMMRQRCNNPKYTQYRDYGGRGIKVCDKWSVFSNFLEDMGDRPEGMTLDRKDTNGDYTKDNCKWSTKAEQVRNTRRNVWIERNGERMILSDWAKRIGVNPVTLGQRYRAGLWP